MLFSKVRVCWFHNAVGSRTTQSVGVCQAGMSAAVAVSICNIHDFFSSLSLSLSLCSLLSHSRLLSHSSTLSLPHSLSPHYLSLTLSLHAISHSFSLSHTLSFSLSHTRSLPTHSLSLALFHSLFLSLRKLVMGVISSQLVPQEPTCGEVNNNIH